MADANAETIAKLRAGEVVQIRPRGNSMLPKIKSGQLCTISPFGQDENPVKGDVVLCKVRGNVYLHIVSAVRGKDEFQISNNHGYVNGWTNRKNVYGRLTDVRD